MLGCLTCPRILPNIIINSLCKMLSLNSQMDEPIQTSNKLKTAMDVLYPVCSAQTYSLDKEPLS